MMGRQLTNTRQTNRRNHHKILGLCRDCDMPQAVKVDGKKSSQCKKHLEEGSEYTRVKRSRERTTANVVGLYERQDIHD